MMTILVLMVVGAIVLIIKEWTYVDDWIDFIGTGFMGALFSIIPATIIAFSLPMQTYNQISEVKLETLNDNSGSQGNFFLGCGSIDSEMKYVFYYNEKGFYKMGAVNYEDVKIKYSTGFPKLVITKIAATESVINLFALDLNFGDKKYVFHVPKGTINNSYNLDAK